MATKAGELFVDVGARTTDFERGMARVQSRLVSTTKAFGAAAGVGGAFALTTALVGAGRAAVDFDRSMRNVNSIAGLSEKQLGALQRQVLALSKETGKGPKDLADGLYDIVSSGFKANDAVKILAVSAKAATAGLTDTATATNAVDAALNAYHLSAGRAREVSDVLFQVVNKGVINFQELAQNMGDIVPVSAPLGVSLKEAGAALSAITLQGVPAAEAATRVKNVMIALAKPSDDMKKLLHDAGYETGQMAVQQIGLEGVLKLVSKATDGNVQATAKLVPEIRGMMGLVGLTGQKNLATYEEHLRSMDQATQGAGATTRAYNEQTKGIAFQWTKATNALRVSMLPLINDLLVPSVAKLTNALSKVADFLEKHREQIKATFQDWADEAGEVAHVVDTVVEKFGGWKTALELAVGAVALSKVTKLAGAFVGLGGKGGIGAAAAALSGKNGGLLSLIAALPPQITIPVTIAVALRIAADKTGVADMLSKVPQWVWGALKAGGAGPAGTFVGAVLEFMGMGGGSSPQPYAPQPPPASAAPKPQGSAGYSSVFPIPTGYEFAHGGGMAAHESRPMGNWQSDRAVDIMVTPGTPILAPISGRVHLSGHDPRQGAKGTVFGWSVTIVGEANSWFITHLASTTVKEGQWVRAGDLVGYSSAGVPGGPHVHVAAKSGNPEAVYSYQRVMTVPAGATPTATPEAAATTTGAAATAPATSTSKKGGGYSGISVPIGIQQRIADAQLSGSSSQLLAALKAKEQWLREQLAGATGQRRLDLTNELTSTMSDIAGAKPGGVTVEHVAQAVKTLPSSIGANVAATSSVMNRLAAGIAGGGLTFGRVTASQATAAAKEMQDTLRKGIVEATKAAVSAAQQAVDSARTGFSTAFDRLAQSGLRAFDARTQTMADALAADLQSTLDKIDTELTSRLAGIEAVRKQLTPSEKALQDLIAGHDAAARQRAVDDAQKALNDARASGDPQAILAAEQQLNEQRYQIDVDTIRKQADLERQAADAQAELDSQAARDAADSAKKNAQDAYAQKKLDLDSERQLERDNFEQQLADLAGYLTDRETDVDTANGKLKDLFAKFGVDPSFEQAGVDLGSGFKKGLLSQFDDVDARLKAYWKAVAALSAAAAGKTAPPEIPQTVPTAGGGTRPITAEEILSYIGALGASGFDLSGLLAGSYDSGGVLKPGWTLAHNATGADEFVLTPGQMRGGGDTIIHVNVRGSVISERELIAAVIDGLNREGRRRGGVLRSGATTSLIA